MSIRIVIADDHNLVREGLKNFLSFDPELEVVGLAADGREAVELTRQFRPEVVLMDLAMPNLSGLEALRLIRQEVPESIILVLSGGQEVEKIASVIRAGAKGYLLKNLEGEQLCQVIKTAAMGGPLVFSPEVAQALTGALPTGKADLKIAGFVSSPGLKLTARELEVLRLLAKGYANKQIAYELRLSEKTVKLHISILLSKLGVQNRSQAAIVATQMGIVASSPFEEKVEQSELTSS